MIDKDELQKLTDAVISFQLDVRRLESDTVKRILRRMEGMRRSILSEIINETANGIINQVSKRKQEALLTRISEVISESHKAAKESLNTTINGLAKVQADSAANALDKIVIDIGTSARLTPETIARLSRDLVVEGNSVNEWFGKLDSDTTMRVSGAIRQGIINGESTDEIVARLIGAAGVLTINKRNLETIILTSMQAIANDTRMAVYEENAEHTPNVEWLAAMDSKSCPRCLARNGLKWNTKTKEPVGHSIPFEQPPIHPRDRCLLLPVPLTLRELGFDVDEPTAGTRASSKGPISAGTTMDEFFARQSVEVQNEQIGVGRAQLWRDKKITLSQLIDGRGREMTLTQLQAGVAKGAAGSATQTLSKVAVTHSDALSYVQDIGKTRNIESAFIYNPKTGKEIFRKIGQSESVIFSKEETDQMLGNILVHNHPGKGEATLSLGDLRTAGNYGLKEIIAVTPTGTQFSGTVTSEIYSSLYTRAKDEMRKIALSAISSGFDEDDALSVYGHALNTALDERKVFTYRVDTPSDNFTKLIGDNKDSFDSAVKRIIEKIKGN